METAAHGAAPNYLQVRQCNEKCLIYSAVGYPQRWRGERRTRRHAQLPAGAMLSAPNLKAVLIPIVAPALPALSSRWKSRFGPSQQPGRDISV